MEQASLQEPKREPDSREYEPMLVGDYLVNIYSKALQPRRRIVCTACVLRLKASFEPSKLKCKNGKEMTFNPIDRLRIYWHSRYGQRVIRSGECQRCGKVYTENEALRPATTIS